MLTVFIAIVHSDNLIFLIFSQFLLFLTCWEILRMLEFKSFENKKEDRSNFLLSRCKIKQYDLILIILINLFVFLLNFQFLASQIFCFIFISICLLKLTDISIVKVISLLYVTSSFVFK